MPDRALRAAGGRSQATRAVEVLRERYVTGINTGDVAGLAGLLAEDARLMPPNAPVLVGRRAIRAAFGELLSLGLGDLACHVEHAEQQGGLVVEIGAWTARTAPEDGEETSDRGTGVRIWRRQPDGGWRLWVDIWNSDLPAARP